MGKIERLHFGDDVFNAPDPEFFPAALLVPCVDAAKGTVAPAASAAEKTGDG